MGKARHLALLRGINVGGRNLVPMKDLRVAISERFDDVETYIQSGNVLFDADAPRGSLELTIETLLEEAFGVRTVVVVLSHRQLRSVVGAAPEGFGEEPDRYHSDVLFLKPPVTAARVMRVIELREGVDRAWSGRGVVYFARLSARRSQSRLSRIVGSPEYQSLTIRSWSTTTRLLDLLDRHT